VVSDLAVVWLAGCVLCRFDEFWRSREPEDIMAYPRLKEEFLQELQRELLTGKPLTLKHQSVDQSVGVVTNSLY